MDWNSKKNENRISFLKSIMKRTQSGREKRSLILFVGTESSLVKMSSAPEPPAVKKETPKEKDLGNPGLRGLRTTTLFRAVNPELFIKPVRNASRIRLFFFFF